MSTGWFGGLVSAGKYVVDAVCSKGETEDQCHQRLKVIRNEGFDEEEKKNFDNALIKYEQSYCAGAGYKPALIDIASIHQQKALGLKTEIYDSTNKKLDYHIQHEAKELFKLSIQLYERCISELKEPKWQKYKWRAINDLSILKKEGLVFNYKDGNKIEVVKGNIQEAIPLLLEAYIGNPEDISIIYNLGVFYYSYSTELEDHKKKEMLEESKRYYEEFMRKSEDKVKNTESEDYTWYTDHRDTTTKKLREIDHLLGIHSKGGKSRVRKNKSRTRRNKSRKIKKRIRTKK